MFTDNAVTESVRRSELHPHSKTVSLSSSTPNLVAIGDARSGIIGHVRRRTNGKYEKNRYFIFTTLSALRT